METVVFDISAHDQLLVRGADRARFLQGMCTGNLATRATGEWLRSCFLSPKGRVLAIADITLFDDAFWLVLEPGTGAALAELLERHAIVDDIEIETVSRSGHHVWEDAAAVWSAPLVPGPPPAAGSSPEAVEARRLEAGLPRYGVDVDAANFPFESLLERLVDYRKGCYVGQEPVARVKSRGGAAKMLRGLRVEGDGEIARGATVELGGDPAGVVTSAAISPALGSLALAYLGRRHWEVGADARVDGRPARVVELPFA